MGRGQWGEGITETTLKDTWTKSRGRVEVGEGGGFGWGRVEGWGEKAHNCNWITIKNWKKRKKKERGLTSLTYTVCPSAAITQCLPVPCPWTVCSDCPWVEGSCSLNVTVSTPGLIVSRVSYYVSGSKQYSSFALILESCAFSSSASIILSALFFLLIQTKHCLSVVGRALQGSCPQRSDTQSFLCKHAPIQHSGTGCRVDQSHTLDWLVCARVMETHLSFLCLCPVSLMAREGLRYHFKAWDHWTFLRGYTVCIESGSIMSKRSDTVEQCKSS